MLIIEMDGHSPASVWSLQRYRNNLHRLSN